MAVSKTKKKKKREETRYINKLSQYMHLSNSGFTVSVDVADKSTYPHAKIGFYIGTFGVMNNTLELTTPSHVDNFVTPEDLMLLSALFARAAKIVNDTKVIREDTAAQHRKEQHFDEKEISSLAGIFGLVKTPDEASKKRARNRMISLHNEDLLSAKKALHKGEEIENFAANVESMVKHIVEKRKIRELERERMMSKGSSGMSPNNSPFDELDQPHEFLEYTEDEKLLLKEAYKVYEEKEEDD